MKVALLLSLLIISASAFDWKKLWAKKKSRWSNKMDSVMKHAKKIVSGLGEKQTASKNGKPWFCHGLDCPQYKLISKTDKYEERCYPETTWVATSMKVPHTTGGSTSPMFRKLFKYIEGENDKKMKVPMTAPVLTTVSLDKTEADKLDVTMHFYVPPEQLSTLPKPTSSDVKIVKQSKMCVYVYSFGGWMMGVGPKMNWKMKEFSAILKKDGKKFDESLLLAAGYDEPWRVWKRHNEIMFKKATKMSTDDNSLLSISSEWKNKKSTWSSKIKAVAKFASKKIKNAFGGKSATTNNGKPWFCHELDCPSYTMVKKTDKYEERCYPDTTWVATSMKVPHKTGSSTKSMFWKLFDYIQGENDKKMKVPMTAPVLTTVSMDKADKDKLDVTMHFYVPPKQLSTIPKPTRSDVKIVKQSKMCVYVYSFGGWMMGISPKMKEKMNEFKAILQKDGKTFDQSMLLAAGYDGPRRKTNRHNEIMFKVSDKVDENDVVVINNVA